MTPARLISAPARRAQPRPAPRTQPPARTPATTSRSPATSRPTGGFSTQPVRPQLRPVPGGSSHGAGQGAPATRQAPFVVLLVVLLVATTLALLFLNTAIAVDSLKATQQRTANEQRAQQVARLHQQVTSGSTAARLAEAAEAAGLVPAGTPAYLVIEVDGSSAARGLPVPADGPGEGAATGSD